MAKEVASEADHAGIGGDDCDVRRMRGDCFQAQAFFVQLAVATGYYWVFCCNQTIWQKQRGCSLRKGVFLPCKHLLYGSPL